MTSRSSGSSAIVGAALVAWLSPAPNTPTNLGGRPETPVVLAEEALIDAQLALEAAVVHIADAKLDQTGASCDRSRWSPHTRTQPLKRRTPRRANGRGSWRNVMFVHTLASQNTTPPPNLQTIIATLSSLSADDLQSVHSYSLWELMDRDFKANGIST